jgi:hypothetical protein
MIYSIGIAIISATISQNIFSIVINRLCRMKFLIYLNSLKQRKYIHVLKTSVHRFSLCRPLGRMLLSFLNKDPISAVQQSGNVNHDFSSTSSNTNSSALSTDSNIVDNSPVRHCILPVVNKMETRVTSIESMCQRTLTTKEKEQLNDIQQLFRIDATYSPMLTIDHVKLLSN